MAYTDEQLLNLVNNTILNETSFLPEDMTGGSCQVSITQHSNLKYKIHLFFGYDKNRNSISFTKEIKDVLFGIWTDAILKKTLSIHSDHTASLFGDINELMLSDSTSVKESGVKKKVEVKGIGKGRGSETSPEKTSILRTENEQKNEIIKEAIDYLNEQLGSKYRYNSKTTIRVLTARIKDGYSIDDIKTVIDKKNKTWGKDRKMVAYMRPETLFGEKFESYLNEISKKSSLDVKSTQYKKEEF